MFFLIEEGAAPAICCRRLGDKPYAHTKKPTQTHSNCDIKNLTRGCRVWLPTFVEGANLSMGDMHFSQGDGEVSFCGAIEMSGFLELR